MRLYSRRLVNELVDELTEVPLWLLLYEDRMDFVRKKWGDRGINSSHDAHGEHQEPHAIINHFANNADPTKTKKYLDRILHWYDKGHFRQEDHGRVKQTLETFEKKRKNLPKDQQDVNRFKKFGDLRTALFGDAAEKAPDWLKGQTELGNAEIQSGTDLLHDSDRLAVRQVNTQQAMNALGAGTEWCVVQNKYRANPYHGAGDDSSYFDNYKKEFEGSHYYHLHDKTNNRRALLHFESNQLMDEQDQPLETEDWIKKHPELHGLFGKKHPNFVDNEQLHKDILADNHGDYAKSILSSAASISDNGKVLRKLADHQEHDFSEEIAGNPNAPSGVVHDVVSRTLENPRMRKNPRDTTPDWYDTLRSAAINGNASPETLHLAASTIFDESNAEKFAMYSSARKELTRAFLRNDNVHSKTLDVIQNKASRDAPDLFFGHKNMTADQLEKYVTTPHQAGAAVSNPDSKVSSRILKLAVQDDYVAGENVAKHSAATPDVIHAAVLSHPNAWSTAAQHPRVQYTTLDHMSRSKDHKSLAVAYSDKATPAMLVRAANAVDLGSVMKDSRGMSLLVGHKNATDDVRRAFVTSVISKRPKVDPGGLGGGDYERDGGHGSSSYNHNASMLAANLQDQGILQDLMDRYPYSEAPPSYARDTDKEQFNAHPNVVHTGIAANSNAGPQLLRALFHKYKDRPADARQTNVMYHILKNRNTPADVHNAIIDDHLNAEDGKRKGHEETNFLHMLDGYSSEAPPEVLHRALWKSAEVGGTESGPFVSAAKLISKNDNASDETLALIKRLIPDTDTSDQVDRVMTRRLRQRGQEQGLAQWWAEHSREQGWN